MPYDLFKRSGKKTVAVVDDRDQGRRSLAQELKEVHFEPKIFDGRYPSIDVLVDEVIGSKSDAGVFDYKLNSNNYVPGTGAQALYKLYEKKFPSVLITNIDDQVINDIRPYRPHIPVLIDKDELQPEYLKSGIEICEKELKGEFQPDRRPWRATVRINWVDRSGLIGIVVPGWNSEIEITVNKTIFPNRLHSFLQEDQRFFAQVNIGAEDQSELYFTEFEDKSQ